MTAPLFFPPAFTPLDGNGLAMPGAKLYFYQTGTTTPQDTYSDADRAVGHTNANPVVADANGLFGPIYLLNTPDYSVVMKTSADVTVWTRDPYPTGANSAILVGYTFDTALNTFYAPANPQGRLTLATGVPVMTTAQTGKTTIYYTPYVGTLLPIYDGVSWAWTVFGELTNDTTQSATGKAGPAAVGNNSNYDLFAWVDTGTVRLTRGAAWNSATARSSGTENDLQRINGLFTNKNAITNGPAANRGTYLGTVRSDGSAQINWQPGAVAANGTAAILGVWNCYNRRNARGLVGDSTNSWVYSSATVRPANTSTAMRVSFIHGLAEDFFEGIYTASGLNDTNLTSATGGIGYDSTTAFAGWHASNGNPNSVGSGTYTSEGGHAAADLGFHFMQALEASSGGAQTWYGDNNIPLILQTGLRYGGWF